MKKLITAVLILSVCCFAECKKNKPDANGLPAATQEGKNTLGFLLNGTPWTPQGNNGTANLSIDFDAGLDKGVFDISAYRILSSNNREYFGIGMKDSLNFYNAPFTVSLTNSSLYRFYFSNNSCTFFSTDVDTRVGGSIMVSKLEKTNRIIAGTFNATLNKTGCTEIKITDGRFDMKY